MVGWLSRQKLREIVKVGESGMRGRGGGGYGDGEERLSWLRPRKEVYEG